MAVRRLAPDAVRQDGGHQETFVQPVGKVCSRFASGHTPHAALQLELLLAGRLFW